MTTSTLTLATVLIASSLTSAAQPVFYVNGDCGNDQWSGSSSVCKAPDGPKETIQAALDITSSRSKTIHIAPGVYHEALQISGGTIRLIGDEGPEQTRIHAYQLNKSVVFSTSDQAIIRGVNIYSGTGTLADDGTKQGGGIFVSAGVVHLYESVIRGNTADFGAGIAVLGGSLFTSNCLIQNNTATSQGGGIYAEYGTEIHLEQSTVTNNSAAWGGGVMAQESAVVDQCIIADNTAEKVGGIYVRAGLSLLNSQILRNTDTLSEEWAGGVGVFLDLTMLNCTVSHNTSQSGTGGIAVHAGASIFDSIITHNTGDLSGGVRGIWMYNQVSLRNCYIAENIGTDGGGVGHAASVSNCTIVDNIATGRGGGIDSTALIENSLIARNYAIQGGAGIAARLTIATPHFMIANCLIIHNQTPGLGGGLMARSGTEVHVVNSTLTRNSSPDGGGIGSSMRGLEITNCIVWDNSSPPAFYEVWPVVRYSNFEHYFDGQGNISINPRFIDPEIGVFMIDASSPCIDAGDNSAAQGIPLFDLTQMPRFVDDPGTPDIGNGQAPIIDMGAYEFQGTSCRPDFNNDGRVNTQDFLAFLDAYSNGDSLADFNRDNDINIIDFVAYLNAYNTGCP